VEEQDGLVVLELLVLPAQHSVFRTVTKYGVSVLQVFVCAVQFYGLETAAAKQCI
jgi:hypothetical protein